MRITNLWAPKHQFRFRGDLFTITKGIIGPIGLKVRMLNLGMPWDSQVRRIQVFQNSDLRLIVRCETPSCIEILSQIRVVIMKGCVVKESAGPHSSISLKEGELTLTYPHVIF